MRPIGFTRPGTTLAAEFRSLRSDMASDALIEPLMQSGGQIKDFNRHRSFSAKFFG
jgi:hypothetical protein